MNTRNIAKSCALVLAFCLGMSGTALAQASGQAQNPADKPSTKVTLEQLPPEVRKTVLEQSKGGKIDEIERGVVKGKENYSVDITVNGHSKEVDIDAQGVAWGIEEEVTMAELPAAIQVGLKRDAAGAKIVGIQAITHNGKLHYYVAQIERDGKKPEIRVALDGTSFVRGQK